MFYVPWVLKRENLDFKASASCLYIFVSSKTSNISESTVAWEPLKFSFKKNILY